MKKKNDLVNRGRFSNTLRNDLLKALDNLSEETDIPKSKLLDKAIELLLAQYNKPIESKE